MANVGRSCYDNVISIAWEHRYGCMMGEDLAAAQLSQQLSARFDHGWSTPSLGLTAAHNATDRRP